MSTKTILVVDDAPPNIDLISSLLRDRFKVKAATSGIQALKTAAKQPPPDLILLDIMMPGMDGYEVCRQLKADAATRHIPVVFLSAKVTPDEQRKGMDSGAIGYLTKPVESDLLYETLDLVFAADEP